MQPWRKPEKLPLANPLFPNGLDAIVGYIKQAGRIPCEVKRVAIDGDLTFVHVRYLDWGAGNRGCRYLPLRRRRQGRRALGRAAVGTSLLEQRQYDVPGIMRLLHFSARSATLTSSQPCEVSRVLSPNLRATVCNMRKGRSVQLILWICSGIGRMAPGTKEV